MADPVRYKLVDLDYPKKIAEDLKAKAYEVVGNQLVKRQDWSILRAGNTLLTNKTAAGLASKPPRVVISRIPIWFC
jgi:hypothetical protein